MAFLAAVLALVTVFLLVVGIYTVFFGPHYEIRQRMQKHIQGYGLQVKRDSDAEKDDKLKDKIREPLKFGRFFTSKRVGEALELELQKANILLRGYEFVMLSIASAGIAVLIGFLTRRPLPVVFLLGVIGLFLPWVVVKFRQNNRLNQFKAQIGDTLMLMSNSLKAGHGIMQALEMVAKEMPPPMSEEFNRMMKEISLGVGTEEALQNMADRVGNDDWDMTITAILIQRQTGGSLSEILDNISETIRERIRIKGEIQSLTAQGRLSGVVIAILPVFLSVVLLIINPPYLLNLFQNPIGRNMIYGAAVSEVLGFLLIQKIVNIKV